MDFRPSKHHEIDVDQMVKLLQNVEEAVLYPTYTYILTKPSCVLLVQLELTCTRSLSHRKNKACGSSHGRSLDMFFEAQTLCSQTMLSYDDEGKHWKTSGFWKMMTMNSNVCLCGWGVVCVSTCKRLFSPASCISRYRWFTKNKAVHWAHSAAILISLTSPRQNLEEKTMSNSVC